jgi:hypothetical protein
MRWPLIVLAALTLSGCSDPPTAPDPPPPPVVWSSVAIMVIDNTGVCIDGATAEVTRGQRAGQSFKNAVFLTPDGRALLCDVYEGPYIILDQLTPGEEMTLRGSASGYGPQEQTVTPTLGAQLKVYLELARIK